MSDYVLAVAFDKDGVIFNSEALYEEALLEVAREEGIVFPDGFHGRLQGGSADTNLALLREALGDKTEAFNARWLLRVADKFNKGELAFVDGVESLIECLYEQGFPLALVTNDTQENILRDFNYTRPDLLRYFSVIVSRDMVNAPKPNPEPYLRAAALLGVDNQRLLVIEDSFLGATAALESGARVLLLSEESELPAKIKKGIRRQIKSHAEVILELGL